jgi:hypothetical protein
MHRLFFVAMAMLLTGCPSQVFLDGSPKSIPNLADGVKERRIHAVSSNACRKRAPSLPYQLLERGRDGWTRSCAKIEGFSYRPGNDYFLQVDERPAGDSSALVRLILKEVIEEYPHTQD